MSEEQLKAFIARVKDDPALQDKLKSAQTAEHVVDIAKDCGHHFTAEHVKNILTEEELEVVNGGTAGYCNFGNGALATAAIGASIALGCVNPKAVGM